ncbi:hypothetical protein B0I33_10636 [Prauserella shujinwangii]|uniref:Uncharacterized protein n=1 Tax=Prauserella shujinwangii TaxID=1453103 RepID=A0A2T0LT81_9PSEU|nr:hypothetical protein [Prauserella shujinwangii]PRX46939.1 hypothetical protein B0I33_10636 [Prauserella shujinwangii]
MAALIVLTVLVLAVVARVLVKRGAVRGVGTVAAALRWAALLLVLAGAGLSLPRLLDGDNPALLTVLVPAVSVALAATPLLVAGRRAAVPTTWACGLLLVGLAVVFGLGIGVFLLPGALVLLAAAGLTGAHPEAAGGRNAPPPDARSRRARARRT